MSSSGAWRSLSVSVDANVGNYLSGMRKAEQATKSFASSVDRSNGAGVSFDRAGRSVEGFRDRVEKAVGGVDRLGETSQRLNEFGSKMTRNVTLPMAVAGAASVKMAFDYNSTFTQMLGLADVTAGEVSGLKDAVLGLAGETAKSPRELAEGLYSIRSSGVDAAASFGVLEASAKASALGMGSTVDIADAVTSALNAYGAGNLSAAQAVDMLVGAVREGKGEADDLAGQMGRLLPVAVQLGLGFEEVAGSVAFLTQTSGDTAQSATQMLGIMNKLVRPSRQAAAALGSVGLSADQVRKVAGEQGLVAALQMVTEAFGSNSEMLGRVFDDSEAYLGVLGLMRKGGKEAAESISNVAGAAGSLDTAFSRLQDTDEFKLQQALVDLERVAIELGQDLIPVLAKIAGGVSDLVDAFTSLPGPVQNGLLILGGFAAALGPLARTAGVATSALKGLLAATGRGGSVGRGGALDSLRLGLMGVDTAGGGAAAKIGGAMRGVTSLGVAAPVAGTALSVLGVHMWDLADRAARSAKDVGSLNDAIAGGASLSEAFNVKLAATLARTAGGFDLGDSTRSFAPLLEEFGVGAEELSVALLGTEKDWKSFLGSLSDRGPRSSLQILLPDLEELRGNAEKTRAEQERLNAVYRALGIEAPTGVGAATSATEILAQATKEAAEAVDGVRERWESARTVKTATEAVVSAMRELGDAQRAAAGDSDELRRAQQTLADAEKSLQRSHQDTARAQEDLTRARREAKEQLEDLALSSEGAALGEREARLSLEEARLRRDEVFGDPTSSALDKERAQLALDRADLALREAIDRRGDIAQDLADANAKGIEGSDQVVAAQDRLTSAIETEEAARRRVSEATQEVSAVQIAAQERVKEATDKLYEAQMNLVDAEAELAGATSGAAAAQDAYIAGVEKMAGMLEEGSPFRRDLQAYLEELREASVPQVPLPMQVRPSTVPESMRPSGSVTPGRAAGGRVQAGRAYIVGERRPEVFVSDHDGTIVPSTDRWVPSTKLLPVAQMMTPPRQIAGRDSKRPREPVITNNVTTNGLDAETVAAKVSRKTNDDLMGW